jgi:membrane protein CcdC involved in cytochrome C biogenesis
MNPAVTQASPNGLILAFVAVLVAFRVYRRMRSQVGPQAVSEWRLIVRALIFLALGVYLLVAPATSMIALEALGIGAVLGLMLGTLGLRHTRFEKRGDKPYYIPNTYIGLAVSLLFIGRIVYRMVLIYPQMQQGGGGMQPWSAAQQNPLTMGSLGLVIGYYLLYNLGLVVLSRRAHAVVPPPGQPAQQVGKP